MLSVDLVRAKRRGDRLIPCYIDEKDSRLLSIAESFLSLHSEYVGKTRYELEAALQAFLGEGKEILVYRGLCRLLEGFCTFDIPEGVTPMDLRLSLFSLAAEKHRQGNFDRSPLLEEVGAIHKITPSLVEKLLYADLKQNHILQEFKPISAQNLLKRYNTALAQALLLRATSLKIDIQETNPRRYRQLFRAIKFYRLLYQIMEHEDRFQILLDGPMSLFHASQKYGLQMALFFPALLLCDGWELRAEILWKKNQKLFLRLDSSDHLYSHYADTGLYQPEEWMQFQERFEALQSPWKISDECFLLNLGQEICIPDYTFVHFSENCVVHLEIFGFWRKSSLEKRILHLKEYKYNLLLAVSKSLYVEKKDFLLTDRQLYLFHHVLNPQEILRLLNGYLQHE